MVNEELWNEVQTYGDVQLMPFVDYYSLITWKTIAICIFGVSSSYIIFFSFGSKRVYLVGLFYGLDRHKLFQPSTS